jgi:hypothetical protein
MLGNRFFVRLFFGTVLVAAAARGAQAQGASLVDDMIIRGRNALDDLKYTEADSLAQRVLVLGQQGLTTPVQNMAALQLRIAALYPDDPSSQKQDSAVSAIKAFIAAGGKTVDKRMSHSGLDSLVALVTRQSLPGKLIFGSRMPGAVLFINDQAQGPLSRPRPIPIPPGKPVKISIRGEKCTPWDTTVTVRATDSIPVGYRPTNFNCQP